MEHSARITVLGVGNPIMGDDGVGITLLEALMQVDAGPGLPGGPRLEFVDGGTAGMSLLPMVESSGSLLVLDAVAVPGDAGTVVHLTGDQLPRLLTSKLSPHQIGLLDVLAGARLLGTEPPRIAVVGVVPADVDLCVGLTPQVAAAVPVAVALAERVLRDWVSQDARLAATETAAAVAQP